MCIIKKKGASYSEDLIHVVSKMAEYRNISEELCGETLYNTAKQFLTV